MSIMRGIIDAIKKMFNRQNVKKVEAPKVEDLKNEEEKVNILNDKQFESVENNELKNKEEKSQFVESLKVKSTSEKKNRRVETLVCPGDGLGIQDKINY